MENHLLIFVSGLAILIGLFGVILPLVPGVWLSLTGLFLFKYFGFASFEWNTFFITLILVVLSQILSFIIPIFTTKKFGGSNYGVLGATIGLFLGLFLGGPFGIIIGPFLGTFFGELLFNRNNKQAFRAALGSFFGFLLSMGIEFMLCIWIMFLYLHDIYILFSEKTDWNLI